jgi:hypothetical protein
VYLCARSGHSYTRPVWRKHVLDMLTDASFFRLPDIACVPYWLTIVDNLVANDKQTFKEILGVCVCAHPRRVHIV